MQPLNSKSRVNEKVVKHKAIVKKINDTSLIVSIMNQSACASCHAKGICAVSDSDQKVIDINNFAPIADRYQIGESVKVSFQQSVGFKALFLGYIFPFLLLFITLIATWVISESEAWAGTLALAVLIPYYLALKLAKNKIDKTFTFTISKI